MSKKRTMIVIEPEGRIHKEAFMTAPMTCPYCNGRGGFRIDTPKGLDFNDRLEAEYKINEYE